MGGEGVEADGTWCGVWPRLVWCEGRLWGPGVWVMHGLEAPGVPGLSGVAWVSRVERLVSFEWGTGRVDGFRIFEGVGCRDTVQIGWGFSVGGGGLWGERRGPAGLAMLEWVRQRRVLG